MMRVLESVRWEPSVGHRWEAHSRQRKHWMLRREHESVSYTYRAQPSISGAGLTRRQVSLREAREERECRILRV